MKIAFFVSSIILILFTHCESKKEEKARTKFSVTSPLRKDTIITRDYVCQIRSQQHIELRALERGYLQKIFIDEGKFVKKGQLLFQVMPLLYQSELQIAKAEAEFVKIEYENTKALADSGVVSQNELFMAKAKLNKARAQQALAQVHLGFTEIRAPFDGIIDRFQVRLGSLVNEGDLFTTLSDNTQMWVYFNVPEAEYLDYKLLDYKLKAKSETIMEVNLFLANNQLFKHKGIVKTIEADFNNETGNIAFRATFPNPDGLLRHGETGNVQVTVPINDKLIIPQKATFEVLDKKYVYVVDNENRLETRKISIAAELPDLYIIKDGLKETDKILLEGLRIVSENDKIDYIYMAPAKIVGNLQIKAE